MSTISKNAQTLGNWLANQSVQSQTSGHLPKATVERAAKALGLSVADVQAARSHLMEQGLRAADLGRGASDLTGRGQVAANFQRGAGVGSAGIVSRQNHVDPRAAAFEGAGYTQLDIKAVAKAMNLSPADAKRHIGDKILRGQEADLRAIGVSPDHFDSHELRDAFSRSGYSVADAKAAVKAFDFLDTVTDAKEYIGLKVVNDYESMLGDVGITRQNFDQHDCLAAFAKSTYSQADVDAAKQKFGFLRGLPDSQVKEYIGLKIVNKYEAMLSDVGITRDNFDSHDCLAAFEKSTYSQADVDAARSSFGFLRGNSDAEVKEYIGLKIVNQYESMLGDVGITRHNFDSHDCLAAFAKSTYSQADVDTARQTFGFLRGNTNAEVKEYIGLKIVNGTEAMLSDVGITQQPFDRHDCLAAFAKSAYSAADVDAARSKFDFLKGNSDVDVKAYIGLKIVNDYEVMLKDVGITQQPWDQHDLLAAFDKSGYSKGDVSAARKAFDFLKGDSDVDVKAYIGLKIVNNYESMLKDAGITPRS